MFPIAIPDPVTGHSGPMIPGHEIVGRVVAVGEAVNGFSEGALVVSGAGISCGRCPWCRRGRTNLCERYATVGLQRHGGLAEFVAVPAGTCVDVAPYGLAPDVAALAQPMSIGVQGQHLSLDSLVDEALVPMATGTARQIKTLIDPWATAPRATVS